MLEKQGAHETALQCWRSFWRGATTPSLPALLIILAVNLTGLIALAVGFEGWMARGGDRYLAANAFDQDIYATTKSLDLARRRHSHPIVAIMGGSAIRSMFLEQELDRLLREKTQVPVNVYNLTTFRQSVWEMVALIDAIPKDTQGLVVVEAGLCPYAFGPEDLRQLVLNPKLGLRSQLFDDEVRRAGFEPGGRIGIYFFDNGRFYIPRMSDWMTRLHRFPIMEVPTPFLGPNPHPLVPRWGGKPYSDRLRQHRGDVEANVAVLERLAQRMKQTQLSMVLLDAPVSRKFLGDFGHLVEWRDHRDRMRRLAADYHIPFLEIVDAAGVEESDYFDYCHLTARDAVERITAVLAEHLAGLLIEDKVTSLAS